VTGDEDARVHCSSSPLESALLTEEVYAHYFVDAPLPLNAADSFDKFSFTPRSPSTWHIAVDRSLGHRPPRRAGDPGQKGAEHHR
jgi:hypothetical protein